jgi:hypothetical protein
MDEVVRIPIDVGYEVATSQPSPIVPSVQQTTGQEDGTLVIDILVPQPCPVEPSTSDEIVVCAQADGDPQMMLHAPEPTSYDEPGGVPKAELSLGRNAKMVVRGETDPPSGSQRVMIDFKLKF